jgi:hypothetical protein
VLAFDGFVELLDILVAFGSFSFPLAGQLSHPVDLILKVPVVLPHLNELVGHFC